MGLGLVCLLPDEARVEVHLDKNLHREDPGFSGVPFQRVVCRTTGGITRRSQEVFSWTMT